MKIMRTPSTSDRDQWSVSFDDGRDGHAWAAAGVFTDEEALAELNRQRIVLHHAFTSRVRSLVGLELKR